MTEKTHFDVRTDLCKVCRHFDVLTDVGTRQQTGICRLNPPRTFAQAVPVPGKGGAMGLSWSYSSMWTMVKESDWCGQFARKFGT